MKPLALLLFTLVVVPLVFPAQANENATPEPSALQPNGTVALPDRPDHATSSETGHTSAPAYPAILFPPSPVLRDIRTMFALQDAIANGHPGAVALQERLLIQISGKLSEPRSLTNPNAEAATISAFVLSGGNPGVVDNIVKGNELTLQNRRLLLASASYMKSDFEKARTLLAGIDPATLPAVVGGRVALVQAMLEASDTDRRQALLSLAVALMPGSLVEESALRRAALTAAEHLDQSQFWKYASRYQRRFSNSLYAPEFMKECLSRMVDLEAKGKRLERHKLDLWLQAAPVSVRQKLLVDLARRSARKNQSLLSKFSAARLQRLAVAGSQEEQIALLYLSLFGIVANDNRSAAQSLRAIQSKILPPQEQRLLRAALAVADKIAEPLQEPALLGSQPTSSFQSAATQRAEAALAKVADLLVAPQ